MKMSIVRTAMALTLAGGSVLAAQGPGGPGAPGGQGMGMGAQPAGAPRTAEYFLAHVGELQLTDAQVTRLAAIARRAESRRQAQRTAMDSMRSRMMANPPADSAARAARRTMMQSTMRSTMERTREQQQADLRDALAVLTPDQQARAWQLRGPRDGGMRPGQRGAGRGRPAGQRRMRDGGPGMGRGRGAGPMRGPGAGRVGGQGGPGGMPGRPPMDSTP